MGEVKERKQRRKRAAEQESAEERLQDSNTGDIDGPVPGKPVLGKRRKTATEKVRTARAGSEIRAEATGGAKNGGSESTCKRPCANLGGTRRDGSRERTVADHGPLEKRVEELTEELRKRNKMDDETRKCIQAMARLMEKVEKALENASSMRMQGYAQRSSAGSARDGGESLALSSRGGDLSLTGVDIPRIVPKPHGGERKRTYMNVVKEFNEAVILMKDGKVPGSEKLKPLTTSYVRDAQVTVRTKLDTTLPGVRGHLRVRKAFENHGRELGRIVQELEQDFYLLRQGNGQWMARAIIANVLENAATHKRRGVRSKTSSKISDHEASLGKDEKDHENGGGPTSASLDDKDIPVARKDDDVGSS